MKLRDKHYSLKLWKHIYRYKLSACEILLMVLEMCFELRGVAEK